ncbi:hypothetical protein MLD38_018466 [Melastoma candidum]|uniref:Uncharacterized protein n=1 Tax=Melastoma candidum TaxID=119954 RepID=A0ACB9QXY6_9MYRT|nr:hypothetical protein MLD38_018466 [Melastoma candidum]
MDRGITKGSLGKYQSGCACTFGSTEPVSNICRVASRRVSVVKAAVPLPEQVSISDDRIMSSVDNSGPGGERITQAGECAGSRREDYEAKGRRRSRHVALTDISCGRLQPKSRGSHGHGLGLGLGCRSITGLHDEGLTMINVRKPLRTKESAEAVVNQKFIDRENSKQFMEALSILNSNKTLFVKLLEDPNSFLAKHIRELRESGENGWKSEAVPKLEAARQGAKDVCSGTLSPRKLKIWEKLLPRRSAEKDKSCEIVILKPGSENRHDEYKRGSYFGSDGGGGSGNGIRVVRQSRAPFGSIRKTLKHRAGGNHEESRELEKGRNDVSRVEATTLAVTLSCERKELDQESFIRRTSREDQGKVSSNVILADVKRSVAVPERNFMSCRASERFGEHEYITEAQRSCYPRDDRMPEDQCKSITNKQAASIKEPEDQLQLTQTIAESMNIAGIPTVMRSGKYDTFDHQSSQRHELERIEIAKRFLQDVCQEQTASSTSDDSLCNFTEESEASTSTSDGAEEERSSPVSVPESHVDGPLDSPSKPDCPRSWLLSNETSNTPPDMFTQTTEFIKSVLISSDLSWDAILPSCETANQLLTSHTIRDTGSSVLQPGINAQLLCDYTSEVLGEAVMHRWHSYQRSRVVDGDVTREVMERMDWDLALPPPQQLYALESIITRDLTKRRISWMQLGKEKEGIAVELTGMIIDDVVHETLKR